MLVVPVGVGKPKGDGEQQEGLGWQALCIALFIMFCGGVHTMHALFVLMVERALCEALCTASMHHT